MRVVYLLLAVMVPWAIGLGGCDFAGSNEPKFKVSLVPDSTVFVVSTLEYSPDTTFHHPQVYVAYLTDPRDPRYSLWRDPEHKPNEELWHPLFWAQVGMKLNDLRLRPEFEPDAEVTVTGPLGAPGERTVRFSHEARGAYGDLSRTLQILSRERYRLDVHLPDGRRYTSETRVPSAARITFPDTVRVPVQIMPFPRDFVGAYSEHGRKPFEWAPAPADEATLTVWGVNRSLAEDYRLLDIRPQIGESLPYEDRNDYVRVGAQYTVQTTAYAMPIPDAVWAETSNYPIVESHDLYLRLYQLSPALGLYYSPEDNQFFGAIQGDPWQKRWWDEAAVVSDRHTEYLPSISNILRVGPDGRSLPKAQSDAVGVFGSYSARYSYRAMVPVRSFDPAEYEFRPAP